MIDARYALGIAESKPRWLAALSHRTNFSVGCHCEDEAHRHRSVLRVLLIEKGAKVA